MRSKNQGSLTAYVYNLTMWFLKIIFISKHYNL